MLKNHGRKSCALCKFILQHVCGFLNTSIYPDSSSETKKKKLGFLGATTKLRFIRLFLMRTEEREKETVCSILPPPENQCLSYGRGHAAAWMSTIKPECLSCIWILHLNADEMSRWCFHQPSEVSGADFLILRWCESECQPACWFKLVQQQPFQMCPRPFIPAALFNALFSYCMQDRVFLKE